MNKILDLEPSEFIYGEVGDQELREGEQVVVLFWSLNWDSSFGFDYMIQIITNRNFSRDSFIHSLLTTFSLAYYWMVDSYYWKEGSKSPN